MNHLFILTVIVLVSFINFTIADSRESINSINFVYDINNEDTLEFAQNMTPATALATEIPIAIAIPIPLVTIFTTELELTFVTATEITSELAPITLKQQFKINLIIQKLICIINLLFLKSLEFPYSDQHFFLFFTYSSLFLLSCLLIQNFYSYSKFLQTPALFNILGFNGLENENDTRRKLKFEQWILGPLLWFIQIIGFIPEEYYFQLINVPGLIFAIKWFSTLQIIVFMFMKNQ